MANEQNLTPFQPGQSGNPAGKKPGTMNWSTIVKQVLSDQKFFEKIIQDTKNKPKWVDYLPNKNAGSAIVAAMTVKAMQGDKKAADWLRKTGFGDKLDITTDGEKIVPILGGLSVSGSNSDAENSSPQ